jgi:hypothetical protein
MYAVILFKIFCLWDVRIYFLSLDCNFIHLENKVYWIDQSIRPNKSYISNWIIYELAFLSEQLQILMFF